MSKDPPTQMLSIALVFGMIVMPTMAQTGGMPADVEAKVAALGAVINPPETAKIYASLHENEPYPGVKVARDLKFGADADRQALDVFVDDAPTAAPRPVLIFVHGGGFVRGGRRTTGTSFYDNNHAVRRAQRHGGRQHHLPTGAPEPLARGRRGRGGGGALGWREHRGPRRRRQACIPDGPFRRRRARRELRFAC